MSRIIQAHDPPYGRPNNICRQCGNPSPGAHTFALPARIAELFLTLPWSDDPRTRFLEKLMLLKAIADRETPEAERALRTIYERDANGTRHGRWPEGKRSCAV